MNFKIFNKYTLFSYSTDYDNSFYNIFGIKIKIRKKKNIRDIFQHKIETFYPLIVEKQEKLIEKLREEAKVRKLRVCFFVLETQKWNMQSLYDKMEKSENFEPFVFVSKLRNLDNRNSFEHNVEFFKKRCKNVELGFDVLNNEYVDIKTFSPDIIFFQQPLDMHEKQDPQYVSDFALSYYAPYPIGESPGSLINHLDFCLLMHRHFIFSEEEEKQYDEACGYKEYNISIIGHPKLDIYSDYKEENNQKRYVIYAPHHSLEKKSLNYATFRWSGKHILEWAKSHPEFEWVFKPHPRLKTVLINKKIMSEKEVEQYYKDWEKIGTYYNDGDYFDIFKNSQCLITDCGSFLIEYLPTEQPVIHLRNPKATDYMASCELAMESYYKAWNIKELDKYLNEILIKKNDSKKQERINVLEQLKIKNNNATNKIMLELKNIYEIQ